jgi:nucleotide-binding universal stress UspA family protein
MRAATCQPIYDANHIANGTDMGAIRQYRIGAMFKRILIATDGSSSSAKAAELAVRLADSLGAELIALTVTRNYPGFLFSEKETEDIEQALQSHSDAILNGVIDLATKAKMPCKVQHIEHEAPFRAILDAAESFGCDLIVMGSHGRSGLQSVLLGSVTQKVLALASLPVLVAR